ncbi:MAG: hypothetical protein ABF242_10495 [Flavobacteriales bacterium]
MKKALLISIAFSILVLGYCNLPFSIRYYSEIKIGEEYILKIQRFKDSAGYLPETNDWKNLKPLMPKQMENEWSPEYLKFDSNKYKLVYPVGFDGPYLQYSSKTEAWIFDF